MSLCPKILLISLLANDDTASLSELRFRKDPTLTTPPLTVAPAPPVRRSVAVRFTLRTLFRRATELAAAAASVFRRTAGVPVAAAEASSAVILSAVTWRTLLRPSVSPRIILRRGGRFGAVCASESEVRWRPDVASVCDPYTKG
jgi:hypothetical protein